MAELACVNPVQIEDAWPKVSEFIREAMRRGDGGKFEELEREVLSGDALLWLCIDGQEITSATVTQIGIVESGKVCTIVACGGSCVLGSLSLLEKIENYASAEGCRAMRIIGRKGWMRALPDYRLSRVVLEKEL